MTKAEIKKIAFALCNAAADRKGVIDKATMDGLSLIVAALDKISTLEARVAELEAKPALEHVGTWQEGKQFESGNMVTDHGSLWLCTRASSERPGTSDAFRLIVKNGHAHGRTFPR